MRFRSIFILLLVAGIALSVQWRPGPSSQQHSTEQTGGKKKKKKKKKAKEKSPKKIEKEKAKAKKKQDKKQAKMDARKQKLIDERAKKREELAKEREKGRRVYDKCDSTDIVRTSNDSLILIKYMKIYHSLGGLCYILHLQQMADIEKTSDGFYSVQMKPSKDPRAPADWQTFLYCPIGKPDGMVALTSPAGDTVQVCSYAGEKKNGLMSYIKKGKGVFYQERYTNDEKVWVSDPVYTGGGE